MTLFKRLPLIILCVMLLCMVAVASNIYFQTNLLLSAAVFFGILFLIVGLLASSIAALLLAFERFEKYWISGYPLLLFVGIFAATIKSLSSYSIFHICGLFALILIGYKYVNFFEKYGQRYLPVLLLITFFSADIFSFVKHRLLGEVFLVALSGLLGALILHNFRLHRKRLWIW